ncbi:MAG: hypothetical protein NVS4B10_12910 [Myxococcales bacterium]
MVKRMGDNQIPEGYKPLFRSSPYLEMIGPLFSKGAGEHLSIGLRILEKHTNARGTVHGGLLATVADVALGYAAAFSKDPPLSLVTSTLSIDFAGTAKSGDWIEARADLQRIGSRMAYVNAYIHRGDERIVRASATFVVAGLLDTSRARQKPPAIEIGFSVFSKDGEEEFGAVRDILADGHLVVAIENKGDVLIPLDAIADVIEHKVLLDLQKLGGPIRKAIAHAHDAEVD